MINWKIFMRFTWITIALMVIAPTIWTIVFWDSPKLGFNILLPILIYLVYAVVSFGYLIWVIGRRKY